MAINTTGIGNITTLQEMAQYTNNATSGILFIGGIFMLYVIMIIVLSYRYEPDQALAVSSWSMLIVSIFFWVAQLLPLITPLVFLFITGFTTLYLYSSKR